MIGTAGSGTGHYQVHLPAVSRPGGVTAFSGRCSDRRSCVGTVVPMPRQTSLSLIPAEGFDNNTVCRRGNPERGVPPGKTGCWAWARAADTCEQVNSSVCSHRPPALRLGSRLLIKREKEPRRDGPATSSATVASPTSRQPSGRARRSLPLSRKYDETSLFAPRVLKPIAPINTRFLLNK